MKEENRKSERLLRAMGELNDGLVLSAGEETKKSLGFRKPRWVMAAAAALVLSLAVCAGAAGGRLYELADLFSPAFAGYPEGTGPELELLERLGQPVGVSVESSGVTVTVRSVLRDRHTCVAVLSVYKKGLDGNELSFDWSRLEIGGSRALEGGGAGVSDQLSGDDTLEYVVTWQEAEPIPTGAMELTLENLVLNPHRLFRESRIEDCWKLSFSVEAQDLSLRLPAGQHVTMEGKEAVLEEIMLSPLSLAVDYTVNGEVELSRRENLEFTLTLKDGTVLSSTQQQESAGLISSTMGISEPREECFQCFYTAAFARLVSLEEVESLVIEGEKIPLPKGN